MIVPLLHCEVLHEFATAAAIPLRTYPIADFEACGVYVSDMRPYKRVSFVRPRVAEPRERTRTGKPRRSPEWHRTHAEYCRAWREEKKTDPRYLEAERARARAYLAREGVRERKIIYLRERRRKLKGIKT